MATQEKDLYTLIPLDEYKGVLGIDDREDKLARFCLVTASFTIEQYCKRRLIRKNHFELSEFYGDLFLQLKEYPVKKIIAVFALRNEELGMRNGILIETEFYRILPDCGTDVDLPFSLEFSPAVARMGCKSIKVVYSAGYSKGSVPADLAAACLELAAWNMNRYRGRRVGMTGNIRGAGKEGEHFEMSMPENVKQLLEPYRRKTI
jgi:uncharacterized phiE125 gp8 family phage protein